MEKDENYSANFTGLDYSLEHHNHEHHHHHHHHQSDHQLLKQPRIGETSSGDNNGMIDYMLNNNPHHHHHHQQVQQQHIIPPSGFCTTPPTSFDKLSFADVMQFADFGPKLALNQTRIPGEETGIDPAGYFLRFPVLNDKLEDQSNLMVPPSDGIENMEDRGGASAGLMVEEKGNNINIGEDEDQARVSDNASVQLRFLGEDHVQNKNPTPPEAKNKRKRPRTIKTSEEVESQRMTHIAVERNRRKQMNEHLRVLRSLMPGSYVQRGDQASIIGGAIEFVRELEQLLQCLESQKRRRLYGDGSRQMGAADTSAMAIQHQQQQQQQQQQQPFFPAMSLPNDQMKLQMDYDTAAATGLREETAENKSCLADVEVKLLGFDAMIKILSRRRPGQLVKTIAALEDLQLNILHTNITTIEQTVLYSFNVKVASESRFSADDIASSVQQIFSFIHANSSM